jgi:acetylornithine aminotransferase
VTTAPTHAERYAQAMMNTFGPPKLTLVRGEGAHVWDADGREYVDLLGGIAVNALGHAHPALVEAVTTQLQTLGHVSNFFASEPQLALAEKLLALLDGGPGKVFFTNSGAEANEAAFKLTRRTGRTHVVAAREGFHGRTMGALALTSKAAYREPFEPLPGDVTFVPFGDEQALADAVTDETAAILLEPLQGEAGVNVAPEGYLAAARRVADEHGALLWLDEIQSGMGRTGRWFAHQLPSVGGLPMVEQVAQGPSTPVVEEVAQGPSTPVVEEVAQGPSTPVVEEVAQGPSTPVVEEVAQQPSRNHVVPDVVTVAKGLGGGFPIGACIGLGEAGELLQPGNHGTTFGGNPVACAAALAVLATIEADGLLEHVTVLGQKLRDGLAADPRVTEVRGEGLLIGLTLSEDRAAEVFASAMAAGFIVNNPTPDRIRLAPPLVLTDDDAAAFLAAWPAILDGAFS